MSGDSAKQTEAGGQCLSYAAWREPTARELEMIGFVREVVAEQAEEKRRKPVRQGTHPTGCGV